MDYKRISFLMFLILSPIILLAQIEIKIHRPPPNQLDIEHLWWLYLKNNTQSTCNIYLHAEVTESKEGRIFSANSNRFPLPPGKTTLRANDIKDVKDALYADKYREYILRTGSLPPGSYTACISVIDVKTNREIAEDCIQQEVLQPDPPRLIYPKDENILKNKNPNFSWTRPTPYPTSKRVYYTIKFVEVKKGQTKEMAISLNKSWYEKKKLTRTSFTYPLRGKQFEPFRRYAWRIQAFDANELPLGKSEGLSEVRLFQIGEEKEETLPSVILNIPRRLSGRATISADVSHEKEIDRVVFFVDDKPVLTDYSFPFDCEIDTRGMTQDSHTFEAKAFDISDNVGKDRRDGIVRNSFPPELSPIKVEITSPAPYDTVSWGESMISVQVTHEMNFRICYIKFEIDGEIIWEKNYKEVFGYCVGGMGRALYEGYSYDFRELAVDSDHVIEVSVKDEYDNWGHAGISVHVPLPRGTAIRELQVNRSYRRIGNYFRVELRVGNDSDRDISNLRIRDENSGFQCIGEVRVGVGSSGELGPPEPCVLTTPRHWTAKTSTIMYNQEVVRANTTYRIVYDMVPLFVMGDPSVHSEAKDTLFFSYVRDGNNYYRHTAHVPGISEPNIPEINYAFSVADYLIVTNPYRLFLLNHPNYDQVKELLSTIAILAKEKNGVLGYMSPSGSNEELDRLIAKGGLWERRLCSSWGDEGYLLIVGESDVIPSWTKGSARTAAMSHVHYTDYPYASTAGNEEFPELCIGRIIGDDASKLKKPIETTLAVWRGEAKFYQKNEPNANVYAIAGGGDYEDRHWRNIKFICRQIDCEFHIDKNKCWNVNDMLRKFERMAVNTDVIIYFGHGNSDGQGWAWGNDPDLTVHTFDGISFGITRPFVFALACATGKYQGVTGISEKFFEKGAAVYIGSTETSYLWCNRRGGKTFFEKWRGNPNKSIGKAWKETRRWAADGGRWKRHWGQEYQLYGDPKYGLRR
jgi:hypothetical protein